MKPPELPQVARSLLKSAIVSLVSAGLISDSDASNLIRILRLNDA